MNSVFSEQILEDKLSKLNSTQQCIETLSHWCIFHRSKAEQVVSTWNKQFHSSEMLHKVPLLYLANDILQNSKRKGNEFVSHFWKVLPAALKVVVDKGDERGKNVVSRLINIWEDRKVFGSRAQSLKDLMFSEDAPPPLEFGKKRSRSVKIVKRDSRTIRTKLSIGGAAEKIVSAFHMVISEQLKEEAEMTNCKSAAHRVSKMERDVESACSNGKDSEQKSLAKELEDEENILKDCIGKLKSVEASRVALVSQLKEALNEQESELENVRTQVQVAEARIEEANHMRKRLNGEEYVSKASTAAMPSVDANAKAGQTPRRTAAAIAAEVADKLAASSSSQMIMHSVLSTFAAEEAKSAGLAKAPTPSHSLATISTNSANDSLSNSEKSLPISDPDVFVSAQPLVPPNNSYRSILMPQPTVQNQTSSSQAQFHMLPNPPSQQYLQPSGGIMTPYAYGSISPMPSGPPLPLRYMGNPMVPLVQQPSQITQPQPVSLSQQQAPLTQQQPIPLTQQPSGAPSFRPLQPPGMVYYGHPPHS